MSLDQTLMLATLIGICTAGVVWWLTKRLWAGIAAIVVAVVAGLAIGWPQSEGLAESDRPITDRTTQDDSSRGEPRQRGRENNVPEVQPVARGLEQFNTLRPAEIASDAYVSSESCSECHKSQYHSWHDSYHRTMTQAATPEAVLGNFDNVQVTARGRQYLLEREGDVCWVRMNQPDFPVSPETIMDVPVVMTTGSHHMQVYWYPTGVARTLAQLPIVYLKETDQWVPRTASFLRPADTPISSEMGRWNSSCSQCHSTHPRRRQRGQLVYDTYIAELGISCEACHGPAEQHVAYHRRGMPAGGADPIINPASLSSHASTQVCGQCHSMRKLSEDRSLISERGQGFRPGDDLTQTHEIWERNSDAVRAFLDSRKFPEGDEQALRSVFWDDGMIRIAGREFNGMINTPCHVQGEMSCLSCHSMHQESIDNRPAKEWANDQLSLDALGDTACTQCHSASDYGEKHTHHPQSSSGSRCYNCHMPHTSYGLLKAVRSHTITSPDLSRDMTARRPNACNLCHLDKTLQWTADALQDWYQQSAPELEQEDKEVAASVLWLLKGDAGLRALASWSMGWADAQRASGNEWIAPLIARTLNDPYHAVRLIAYRSIRTLPGYEDFEVNVLADGSELESGILQAFERWENAPLSSSNPAILIDESGSQGKRIEQLMLQRDDTRIEIAE